MSAVSVVFGSSLILTTYIYVVVTRVVEPDSDVFG